MNTSTIISQQTFADLAKLKFTMSEIDSLERFLEPFSDVGRQYVLRLVYRARGFDPHRLAPADILGALQKMWHERWSKGNPGRIGDPDDGGIDPPAGAVNTGGYDLVYSRLGVSYTIL